MHQDFTFDVFLSYSSRDSDVILPLAERLRKDGIRVWLDQWEIRPGDNIPVKIEEGLEACRVLVLCMSAQAFQSDWPKLESGTFRFRDPLNRTRRFVPLLLDDTQIPGSLSQFRYIDWRESVRWKQYRDLVDACASQDSPLSEEKRTPLPPTLRELLTIIIPVYNDAKHIKALIKGLRAEGLIDRCNIMICDDASTDNSFALLQEECEHIPNITCNRLPINSNKVGAIEAMMQMVRTPFVLTLDADCMIAELQAGAFERLIQKMQAENYAAACFRIVPHDRDWFDRLQKLDYTIFTDTLRQVLGVPLCLIGQGVVWRTDCFREVLAQHSKRFDGDDLENTVIALKKNMRLYWERHTLVVSTVPKESIVALFRQRALSWEFGMFRVLSTIDAITLRGDSGGFYRNIILMDFLAHPLRLLAIPLLLGVLWFRLTDENVSNIVTSELYWRSIIFTLQYGPDLIISIWVLSVVNSLLSVRGRVLIALKWAIFNAVYLSSPFVFTWYFPLIAATKINIYDVMGAGVYWLGLGLLLTYTWWVLLTFCMLWGSSLERKAKIKLIPSALLAPTYYGALLTICKTVGICKALSRRAFGH